MVNVGNNAEVPYVIEIHATIVAEMMRNAKNEKILVHRKSAHNLIAFFLERGIAF